MLGPNMIAKLVSKALRPRPNTPHICLLKAASPRFLAWMRLQKEREDMRWYRSYF